jgi:hypothetical protein
MVHDARDTVTDAGTTVLDTIKANPIPSALVAVGIGWLLMSRTRAPAVVRTTRYRVQGGARHLARDAQGAVHGATAAVGHLAQDAGHRVGELATGARETATHLASDATRTGRRAVRGAGRGLRRAEQGIESTLRTNPLALGAVAIAVGAAIGLSLPHTNVEDEWMGETKERLLKKAEGVAGDAIQKAEAAVGQLAAPADKAPDTKNGLGNGLSGSSKSQAV